VKCAGGLVLLDKEEMMIQVMTDKLIEIGRYYGMEINVKHGAETWSLWKVLKCGTVDGWRKSVGWIMRK
jgi:hypothetical protein